VPATIASETNPTQISSNSATKNVQETPAQISSKPAETPKKEEEIPKS